MKPTGKRDSSEVAALKELLAVQERTVIEQTERLEEALKEAQAAKLAAELADKTKSRFLATMSHELRTPLNAIIGFSKILIKNKAENLNPKNLTQLSRIHENGHHLLGLINEVLDISKIEAGEMSYRAEPCTIESIADSVIQLQASLALNKGIELKSEIPTSLVAFSGDMHRLRQVLINLVGNAIKFTDEGSVTIRVAPHPNTAFVERIEVTDTGIGIGPEDLEKIFLPFEQVEGSASRSYSGTGLGLSISTALCKGMGLTLEASSEMGRGSTFRIVVPQALSQEVPATAASHEETQELESNTADSTGTRPRRVLVVDDNGDARQLIAEQLRELQCDVRLAREGGECLRVARSWAPDLITLDLMMPKTNGWQVLSELRKIPELSSIPVVVISMVADESRGTLCGAVEVLKKPVGRTELARILRGVSHGKKRALVVEDNADARIVLSEYLEEEGWQVAEAINGSEGFATISRFRPDVVFLDLMMPVMDGAEFLDRVRATPEYQELPIVVVTAKEIGDQERSALLRKANSVVSKGENLAADLHRILENLGDS